MTGPSTKGVPSGDLHHLAAAYALDALEPDERAAFEAHYPTCDVCRSEVEQFRETAGLLGEAAPATPPAGLEQSVMSAIARTRQLPPVDRSPAAQRRRRYPSGGVLAAAAAVVTLVIAAAVLVGSRGGASPVEEVLAAPDAVVTTLAPTADGGEGTFQVVWSPERDRVAVIANGLPDPGPDRVYELWAIVGETPVPAGLFTPDDGGVRAAVEIDDVDAAAWGVTVEPDGGSAAPTTPILFFADA
ncbi:MAG: anti-sigma factor domain-containing protein [Acidimicrobiia bacterium]